MVDGSQGALHDPSGSGAFAFGSPSLAQFNSPVGARFRGIVDPVGYRVLHIAGWVRVERVQDRFSKFRPLFQGGNVCRPDAARPERFASEPAHPFRRIACPTGEQVDTGIEVADECRARCHPYPLADSEVFIVGEASELIEQRGWVGRGS